MKTVSIRFGCSLPDLVLAWTAEQVRINASALACALDDDARQAIAPAIRHRGPMAGPCD